MVDEEKVTENLDENEKTEGILEEVHKIFEDKLDECPNCVNNEDEMEVCTRHKRMIAKYMQKKYKGQLTDIAKEMKNSLFG